MLYDWNISHIHMSICGPVLPPGVIFMSYMFQGGKALVKPDDQLQLSEGVCTFFMFI